MNTSLLGDPYTDHMRGRLEKYFKGKLIAVYVGVVQISLTPEGFAETFVGYLHEVDLFDIVIRHFDDVGPDRFSLIPISAIKTVSEVGSVKVAVEQARNEKAMRDAATKSIRDRQNKEKGPVEPGSTSTSRDV
jgi:hypothetical protein